MRATYLSTFAGSLIFAVLPLQSQTLFTDITESAGIAHQFQVYEGTFGGGATVFDINNDGFEDIFLTGGTNEDALYLNNKNGTFTNIYANSGLKGTGKFVTQGAVSADVNHDGLRDLFITTISTRDSTQLIPRAHNLLYLNKGALQFEDATTGFNLESLNSFSTGPSFGDVNADGFPDLYVGNYFLEFQGKLGVLKDATIASANQTAKGYLLINKKGASFKNEYEAYGLTHRGFGFGALFTDFDNDGDQDLLINQDFGYKAVPNFLYENMYPRRSFRDISKSLAMDLKINAMGAAAGDFDNNGYLDYYVTNVRFNHLMVHQGKGQPFINLSKKLGTYQLAISWGANFADFDNDMDLDLFVSNGDLNPNCTPMGNFYFENDRGVFTEKAGLTGVKDYGIGRGSVVFDMDNDGDLDLLVVNQKAVREYPVPSVTRLFRNDSPPQNWLQVALIGVNAESNGIGSRVQVVTGKTRMLREIDGGGSSHLSQNSCIAHFGLGTATKADSVIVTWAGGRKQILVAQQANQLLEISEIPDDITDFWILAGVLIIILPGVLWVLIKRTDSRRRKIERPKA